VYNNAFIDSLAFSLLVDSLTQSARREIGLELRIKKIILSGFSAGYGAIRRILSQPGNADRVDMILLLDGIHASYVPEQTPIAEGGTIDSAGLEAFRLFAFEASRTASGKRFVVTHSEIFPGTYVSTTEATDFLIRSLGLRRTAVLNWGPLGMQQISKARIGNFEVLGFAGNTAPDHVDHFHALPQFLDRLRNH
jgi:hypothetical protein